MAALVFIVFELAGETARPREYYRVFAAIPDFLESQVMA